MCDSPYYVKKLHEPIKGKKYTEEIPVSCGKCPPCKQRRVSDWVFRLKIEEGVSSSSYFVTLTYSPENLPRTQRNLATLDKSDLQKYIKRLRKCQQDKIKYYAVGEYGTKTKRPHYHLILLNVQDPQNIVDAWKLNGKEIGHVHIGTVTSDSIAYTAKYIDKISYIGKSSNDPRIPQFSLMSKGIGKTFMSEKMKNWLKSQPLKFNIKFDGKTKSIPRYYTKDLYTEEQQIQRQEEIERLIQEQNEKLEIRFNRIYRNTKNTFESWKDSQKRARYSRHINQQNRK